MLSKLKSKLHIVVLACAAVLLTSGVAYAANTPDFSQTINAGTLSTDILDSGRNPVASPSVTMSAQSFSFDCETSTGTFGSGSERIYVVNPSAATSGWTLSVAATGGASSVWENAGSSLSFDFNDPSGTPTGCDGGQMTVDANAGTLTADCTTCTTTNVSKGSSAAFDQGATDSITLLNASGASDNVWRGYLTDVDVSQTIPGETEADTYSINLTLTATAQ